jgi:hypothetical protein
MWRELIQALSSDCVVHAPASALAVSSAEQALGLALPADLVSLLLETDGVHDRYGFPLVLPLAEIVETNGYFRANSDFAELYMPFDPLLLFGTAANSDYFAFRILKGNIRDREIFRWYHEDDSRTWAANGLELYLEWRLNGHIPD